MFLALSIIPLFQKTFDEFGFKLTPLTQGVISLSWQIQHHPIRLIVVLLIVGTVVFVVIRVLRHFAIGTRWFGLITAGSTANLIAMSGICRRLSEHLNAGTLLPEALRLAGAKCDNQYYQVAINILADAAERGCDEIKRSSVVHNFPANLIHALTAGPDGSPCAAFLDTLADVHREQASDRWDDQGGFWQALAMIAVAIVVGLVVLSLFLPLIDLVSGLS